MTELAEITRYGKIYHKSLNLWKVWHDGEKNRYEEDNVPLDFWQTLDSKLVAWTFNIPQPLGFILRLLFSVIFCTNRYEPYPIGNNPTVNNLWQDKHPFIRWFLWHVRNPFSDLRKFYLGFAYAIDVIHNEKKWGIVHWAKFRKLPFRIPFPVLKWSWGHIGWEERGILSAGIKLKD